MVGNGMVGNGVRVLEAVMSMVWGSSSVFFTGTVVSMRFWG